jgi:hypothetical protein
VSEPMKIVPKDQRVLTVTRMRRTSYEAPRCAIMTKTGGQCTGTVGGTGGASGFGVVNGERVPLCSRHYDGGLT